MSVEIEREILEALNVDPVGLPISGRQLADKLGRSASDVCAAARELERKMRTGRYIFTIADVSSQGVKTDFLLQLIDNQE
ncbi:hypothetical protein [Mycobacterium marinum]|uniref:hypothetical protein n=1 Tax=Mycobacterium marinum TaxID=1781 RepID=UPI002358C09C|nr:hypothetical protein [Mycobacterium marinum]MDC9004088.1 hypothetical protein [Mycobacterium marinum]